MSEQQATSSSEAPRPGQASSGQNTAIDLEKLAEKVYQLMRADARLTAARGQKRRPGR